MNVDVKAQWVAALRSGEYEQGRGNLARVADDGVTRYCCLGVLCALAARESICTAVPAGIDGVITYDNRASFLPPSVVVWAGLEQRNTIVSGISLGVRNDLVGDSFDRIANLIESYL